jgi:hypothetical protein
MRLTDTTSKSPFTRAVRPRPAPLLKPDTAGSVRDTDSLLEGEGFELPVPLKTGRFSEQASFIPPGAGTVSRRMYSAKKDW